MREIAVWCLVTISRTGQSIFKLWIYLIIMNPANKRRPPSEKSSPTIILGWMGILGFKDKSEVIYILFYLLHTDFWWQEKNSSDKLFNKILFKSVLEILAIDYENKQLRVSYVEKHFIWVCFYLYMRNTYNISAACPTYIRTKENKIPSINPKLKFSMFSILLFILSFCKTYQRWVWGGRSGLNGYRKLTLNKGPRQDKLIRSHIYKCTKWTKKQRQPLGLSNPDREQPNSPQRVTDTEERREHILQKHTTCSTCWWPTLLHSGRIL